MTPELALAARVDAPRDRYRFRTADGLHSPDAFRKSDLLLLDHLWDRDTGRTLVPAANYGVVGVVLGDTRPVTMAERDARAVRLARENARANAVDAPVELAADLRTLDGGYDTVAVAPKPYTPVAVAKERLAAACSRLRPGGVCYVAAAPHTGLSRYESALREFATDVERVASRGDSELLRAARPPTFDPPTYATAMGYEATVAGTDVTLFDYPGLFAAGRVDDGTRLLAETAPIHEEDRVLDACCGGGVLGVRAAHVASDVTLTDADAVATDCARRSLAASGVDGRVVTTDALRDVDGPFDLALCNPPTHAGDGVLADLFGRLNGALAPDGRAFVVRHAGVDIDAALRRVGKPAVVAEGGEHVAVRV